MSEVSAAADAFVSAHRDEAHALGERLAELTEDPDAFARALGEGLAKLADPAYTALAERASPGTSAELAVRNPLVGTITRPLMAALGEGSSISALRLAQRLITAPQRDVRLFALPCLRRALADDPEQAWQLMRQMGHAAGDWIEVDSLADVWARGVLAEPFRWAELEQLVYSGQVYERRLVGSTLATIPHRLPAGRRGTLRGDPSERAFAIIGLLIGDAAEMVQKALAWAIREWARVDARGATALLEAETCVAVQRRDGARARVIRDALSSQDAATAAAQRERHGGIRRRGDAASTSLAASHAAGFAGALAGSPDIPARQGGRYTRSRA